MIKKLEGTYCAGVPCHANTMLQGGEAPRHVRSKKLFSLFSPATQAASVALAGHIIMLLLRLLPSRMNRSRYVAIREPPTTTRHMRLTLTPAASRRMRARTKAAKSDVAASSSSWMAPEGSACGGCCSTG